MHVYPLSLSHEAVQVGPPLPMPEKTTICLRTLHYTFMNPVVSSYAFGLFFGSLLPVRCATKSYPVVVKMFFVLGLDWHGRGLAVWGVGDWTLVGFSHKGSFFTFLYNFRKRVFIDFERLQHLVVYMSLFHECWSLVSNLSLSVMLYNQGEGCGVLRLAWVGHWYARTPGEFFIGLGLIKDP